MPHSKTILPLLAAAILMLSGAALLGQKLSPAYVVTTIAGITAIGDGGPASNALLSSPPPTKRQNLSSMSWRRIFAESSALFPVESES
jgi:hypothetical protein